MHSQWRDCQAWKNFGVPLSTTSNEASKMFDATVTQLLGWYDDAAVGGLGTTMTKMMQADPKFVMGHVLKTGLDLAGAGRTVLVDPTFKTEIDELLKLAQTTDIKREKQHAEAVKLWSEGACQFLGCLKGGRDRYDCVVGETGAKWACGANQTSNACLVWEDILTDNPLDVVALKFANNTYIYLGYFDQLRDSVARVLPYWKPEMPLYGYLVGMHAFGLEETNLYDKAEKTARKGLEINPRDAWATHTMCHVMEMMGRQDEGISFMTETENYWASCGMLACHNFWHWALYYIEKGDYDSALGIFDREINVRCGQSGQIFAIVDASSLLYRLEMEGVNVGDRWNDVYEVCRPHIDDHILAYSDVHILMACLGAKKTDVTQKIMTSIKEYVKSNSGVNKAVTEEVGLALCEAFLAYDSGDFARSVEIMKPIRYKVILIGGSHAQRDLFNLFLIQAAIKSSSVEDHKFARNLLIERKALKECAPMTDRLIAKAMAAHAD